MELLEQRQLLVGEVVETFDTEIRFNQFSGGDAQVLAVGHNPDGTENPEFVGVQFCRSASCGGTPFNLGPGISDPILGAQFGADATLDVSGRLGLEFGVFADAGSADLIVDGTFGYEVDDSSGGAITIDTDVNFEGGGLFTQSPTLRAFADLVLELDGMVSGQACFVGCTEQGTLQLTDINQTIQLIGVNRGGDGEVAIVGTDLVEGAIGVVDELRGARDDIQQSRQDQFRADRQAARATTAQEIDTANQNRQAADQSEAAARNRETATNNDVRNGSANRNFGGGAIVQVAIGEDPSDLLGAELEVSVGFGVGNVANVSQRLGTLSVTVPDIALTDTTLDSQDRLSASTDPDDDRRRIANVGLDVASLLQGPLGTFALDLGPLSLEVTTVSFIVNNSLLVNQEVMATPDELIQFEFTDPENGTPLPVDVTVNGVTSNNVTSIQFEDTDEVTVEPMGSQRVEVTPTLIPRFNFTNDIGLDFDITGTLRALQLQLSAFGQTLIDLGPLLEQEIPLTGIDFGSVFDTSFLVTAQEIPFDSFEIGGAVNDLQANVSVRPENPSLPGISDGVPAVVSVAVTNDAPEAASNVVTTINLPDEFDVNLATLDSGCTIDGNTVACVTDELAAGQTMVLELGATPNVSFTDSFQVFAEASGEGRELNPSDNTSSTNVTVARSTFTVVNTNGDLFLPGQGSGEPTCDNEPECTLRAAITDANNNPGPDVIVIAPIVRTLELREPIEVTSPLDIIAPPGTVVTSTTDSALSLSLNREGFQTVSDELEITVRAPNGEANRLTTNDLVELINNTLVTDGASFNRFGITAVASEGDGSGTIDFAAAQVNPDDPARRSFRFPLAFPTLSADNPTARIDPPGPNNAFTLTLSDPNPTELTNTFFDGLDVVLTEDTPNRFQLFRFGDPSGPAEFRIAGLTFTQGAGNNGGAIAIADPDDSLLLVQTAFEENTANFGGAIAVAGGSELTIRDSSLSRNAASFAGGAIDVFNGTVTIENSVLSENFAETGAGLNTVLDSLVNVQNTVFADNVAERGGAINVEAGGELAVTDSQLLRNSASLGSAIAIGPFAGDAPTSVFAERSLLAGNQGGAVVEIFETGSSTAPGEFFSRGFNLSDIDFTGLEPSQGDVVGPPVVLTSSVVADATPGAAVGNIVAGAPLIDLSIPIAVDDPRFEIVAGVLRLRDGAALDAATTPSITLNLIVGQGTPGQFNQPVTLTVLAAPETPLGFAAEPTPDSIRFTANDSPLATEYELVEIGPDGEQVVAILPPGPVDFTLTDLPPLASGTFALRAINVTGSATTTSLAVTLPPPGPSLPQDVLVSILSPTSVRLSFGPSEFADSYTVFQDGIVIAELPVDTTTLEIDALDLDTQFTFVVRANNETGFNDSDPRVFQTPPAPPTEPTGFRATSVDASPIRLEFAAAAPNTEHRVLRSIDGGPFVEIAVLDPGVTSFEADPVSPGSRLEFQIIAVNQSGLAASIGLEGVSDSSFSADRIFINAAGQVVNPEAFGNNEFPDLETISLRGDQPATLIVDPQTVVELTEASDTLTVEAELPHEVEFDDGFQIVDSEFVDGQFFRVAVSGNARVRLSRPDNFHNPVNAFDVNGSGGVTPLDALLVINVLTASSGGNLPQPDADTPLTPNFVDVDQSLSVSPLDALLIINQLIAPAVFEGASTSEDIPLAPLSVIRPTRITTVADDDLDLSFVDLPLPPSGTRDASDLVMANFLPHALDTDFVDPEISPEIERPSQDVTLSEAGIDRLLSTDAGLQWGLI